MKSITHNHFIAVIFITSITNIGYANDDNTGWTRVQSPSVIPTKIIQPQGMGLCIKGETPSPVKVKFGVRETPGAPFKSMSEHGVSNSATDFGYEVNPDKYNLVIGNGVFLLKRMTYAQCYQGRRPQKR